MGSTKVFKRTTLLFDTPISIPKKSKQLSVNSFGYVQAEIDGGVVAVQTKKLKGSRIPLTEDLTAIVFYPRFVIVPVVPYIRSQSHSSD